jgi:hypothetical protein
MLCSLLDVDMTFGAIACRNLFASSALANPGAIDAPSSDKPSWVTPVAEHKATPRGPYVALRINPLALLIRRKSAELEVWPLAALGFTLGVAGVDYGSDASAQYDHHGESSHLTLTEIELGVRYWAWFRPKAPWPNGGLAPDWLRLGAFVGPSFAHSWGRLHKTTSPCTDCSTDRGATTDRSIEQ